MRLESGELIFEHLRDPETGESVRMPVPQNFSENDAAQVMAVAKRSAKVFLDIPENPLAGIITNKH